MLHDVVEARPLGGCRVYVRFDDGMAGEIDLGGIITFEGVFAALRSPEQFAQLQVAPELGTICWPSGADIAPETLYDALRERPPHRTSAR